LASLSFPKIIIFFIFFLNNKEIKINNIEIKGTKKIKPKLVYSLPLKEEAIFELRREIIDFYLKEGFFDVKVNIAMQKKGKNLVLFYLVKEGERYQIGNINIHSNFIRADNLLKLITEKDYSQENLNRIIKKIIDFYWEIGFPFVKIEPKNFELADKKVNFDIFIDEGEMVKINDLRAIGEMAIPPPILKKSSGFTKPFYFQKSLLEKFKRNIYKNLKITWSDYFLSKSEEGGYFLNFYFPFLRKNNFLFFLSYLPNEKSFYFNLNLKVFNFLNQWEEWELALEKFFQRNFYLFTYRQPYLLFFKKIFFTTSFKNFDTTTSLLTLASNIYLPTKWEELSLNFIIQSEFYNSVVAEKPTYQIFSFGQEFIFDNKIDNYQKGNYFSLKTLVGERKLKEKNQQLKFTLESRAEFLFLLFKKNWLFHNEILGGNIYFSDTLYYWEKFFLGGQNYVRGFSEEQYPATSFLIFRNHLKYLFKEIFFPYLFFDYGIGKDNKWFFLKSGGGGIDFLTKNGIFYFSVAFPFGFNLFDTRIYLGYIFQF
jgi:hypothetical protein